MTLYDIMFVHRQVGSSESVHCVSIVEKGSKVVHESETKKLNWSGSYVHNICQDSFLSSLFHFILFYWTCNWTFLSTLLLHFWFLISACIIFLPQPISRMSAFSHCRCRLVTRPSLPRMGDYRYHELRPLISYFPCHWVSQYMSYEDSKDFLSNNCSIRTRYLHFNTIFPKSTVMQ